MQVFALSVCAAIHIPQELVALLRMLEWTLPFAVLSAEAELTLASFQMAADVLLFLTSFLPFWRKFCHILCTGKVSICLLVCTFRLLATFGASQRFFVCGNNRVFHWCLGFLQCGLACVFSVVTIMFRQIIISGKFLSTFWTGNWLFISVVALMLPQIIISGELLSTFWTDKWLFTSVVASNYLIWYT